jgi:hypothetical protein
MDTQSLWQEYLLLQKRADRSKIDSQTWAYEEQATEFLNRLGSGTLPTETGRRSSGIRNLAINRRRKYANRQVLLSKQAPLLYPPTQDVETTVLLRLNLASLKEFMTPDEWRVFERIAIGEDYRVIAVAEHRTIPALKSLVSRCRTRLRSNRTARVFSVNKKYFHPEP